MAIKDKPFYHNIDLLKNYIKNAFTEAGTEDDSLVNLKQLLGILEYDTVKAKTIKNIYTTVGGLTKDTDVSGKTIKEIFDMMFFTASGAEYTLPMVVNGSINIKRNGTVIKTVPFGSNDNISEFVDYDGSNTVSLTFTYVKNDGGALSGIQLNGINILSSATVLPNGTVTVEVPLKTVIPLLDSNNNISVGIDYLQGEQKYDQQGNPSGLPIPAGTIPFSNILTFDNLSYPVFYKNFSSNDQIISSSFNYQTDSDGYLNGKNYADVSAGGILVIGIPVISSNGLTVLGKSANISSRFIRRDISISSSVNTGTIAYKLYYLFANENEIDFTVGNGSDLSKLATSDVIGWAGVDDSLSCRNQGYTDNAYYVLIEKTFGTQKTGFIVYNSGEIADVTSASCLVVAENTLKLAELSLARYSTLDELYDSVPNIIDAKNLLENGTESIFKNGNYVKDSNNSPIANIGFGIFKTGYGFAVMGIDSDNVYTLYQFPKPYSQGEDWRVVTASGSCELLFGLGTGFFRYQTIELYKNGSATGITKPNSQYDKDYIAPKITAGCLNITNNLGTGINNSNNQYNDVITCNNQLNSDKNALAAASKVEYVVSGINTKCYEKIGNEYKLAGKSFVFFTMVQVSGTYYKILKVNPDSSWQLLYYSNNTLALVPTGWIGYTPTAGCVLSGGLKTGYLHYTQIQQIYTDNIFQTPLNPAVIKNNGDGGDTVNDVLSDSCKATDGEISTVDVTYSELIDIINNSGITTSTKYRITDFRTVSAYRGEGDSADMLLSGNMEVLQVTGLNATNISPIAVSENYPNDVIYYNVSNDFDNNLYAGATHGYIVKRINTLTNTEFDFDFRGLKSGRSTRLTASNNNLVVNNSANISNCKIELKHDAYANSQLKGSSVIFESCSIKSSNVKISGSVAVVFNTTLIINSNLSIRSKYYRVHTYVDSVPTVLNDNNDNYFVLGLLNSDIHTDSLYIGTLAAGIVPSVIGNVLNGSVFNGSIFSNWRLPSDSTEFNDIFKNSVQVLCKVLPSTDPLFKLPLLNIYTASYGKFLDVDVNNALYERFLLL